MSVLMSVILLMAVTNILGTTAGGLFSIAYANAQQFQVLGSFEMRTYQVTDVSERRSFGVYLSTRIITCGFMVITLAIYAVFSEGLSTTALLFFLVGLMRLLDAAEDVFHGLFQLRGRLDIGGRALFTRSLVTAISFLTGLFVFHDLLFATAVCLGFSFVAIYVCNVRPAFSYAAIRPEYKFAEIGALLLECLPLFLGSFLAAYLTNAPKYALQGQLPVDYQAIFSIIFMPAMAVNLLCGFIFRPLLTEFAQFLKEDKRKFNGLVHRSILLSVVALVMVLGCTWFLGVPLLSALYGVDIEPYKAELLALVVGGLFYAVSTILYYALTTLRKQNLLLIGYGLTALLAFISSGPLVTAFGFAGAVMLYDGSMLFLSIIFYIFYVVKLRGICWF